jgi:hypothetical protein
VARRRTPRRAHATTDVARDPLPEIAGDGQRLFDDGLPGSRWTLTRREVGELAEMALTYDRAC